MLALAWGGVGRALTAGALGTGNSCCVSKRSDRLEAPEEMRFSQRLCWRAAGKRVGSQPHAWYESRHEAFGSCEVMRAHELKAPSEVSLNMNSRYSGKDCGAGV